MRNVLKAAAAIFIVMSASCTPAHAVNLSKIEHHAKPLTVAQEATSTAQEIVMQALGLLKTKYVWGGQSPRTGFDCSGFVRHVYQSAADMFIHGTAADLYRLGSYVRKKDLKEGDLVFFNTRGAPKSHVGIYIGDDKFVHALNKRTGVRIDRLSNSYYAARYEGAKSLIN